jgi:hypothetical protein
MATPEPPIDTPSQASHVHRRSPAAPGAGGAIRHITLVCYLISIAGLIFFAWSVLSSLRYDRYDSYYDDQTYFTEYPSPTPTHVPSISRIGETIIIGTQAATLLSVEVIPADQTHQANPGDVIILARMKLTDIDGYSQLISPTDFLVATSSGHPWDYHVPSKEPPPWYTGGHYLPFYTFVSGDTIIGDLIVTAPLGDHQAKLVWSLDFRNVGDSGWILGL